MKIKHISLFALKVPFAGVSFKLSGGRVYESIDSTLVRVDTEKGLSGWGEICPWGRNYLPEFAEGARAALAALAPDLIGLDAGNPAAVNAAMDRLLYGHVYAKAAIDMACWDIVGKFAGLPVHALLGGRQSQAIPLLSSLFHGPIDDMFARIEKARANGVRSFSAKATGNPVEDIPQYKALSQHKRDDETFIADANGGWSVPAAIQVLTAIDDAGIFFEQPCASFVECLRARQHVRSPFILDESVVTPDDLVSILKTDAADALHFKISRVGGITKARAYRDFCAIAGLSSFWEASGGTAVADAAAAHVATSAPAGAPHKFWSCQEYNADQFCTGGPTIANGCMAVDESPGLGVEPISTMIGQPIAAF